uniref:Uncharacterized protein n=2 Tax=Rhizophagus irregularis TaxID=588596 RepID=U9TLT5_RHIID|nr:hypothetical protein GLOIN_2v1778253 [Rhizophagus irregularis DAOM 181602=DAOM 197198]PKB97467.1 hypothetical protein RhiirA5_506608 [Rhizophagus irregularis]POG68460.1 hypothetical protein GLOIN_2v1778253 [Rhizophagus irregularis DAOM 181602=DAOM 197198]UZO14571.1 hypothetical protein OCT59_006027 [Rhizophagus irregularis]CAG8729331.1 19413_t:CDS:1 [Rhizophagus irregularis]GBC38309.1 hypothetical protein GLOIN_2v1778253 [Rhizophagus irregularis DAOM 181602=DAOM 197198]|eukprot:XP_025175326.1 hypothetical protein GLOIN_2v1778253 [Rhizophagus irregularis DAOM 181602=DAOM 197198]
MSKDTKKSFPILLLDVLTSDLKPKDLHKTISDQLEVKYLSSSAQELDEIEGIMFGRASRLISLMTMKIKIDVKNVHFLIDTESSETFVCEKVLNSFNLTVVTQMTICMYNFYLT